MAATTATCGCKTTPFFTVSLPAPPPAHNFSPQAKPVVYTNGWSKFSVKTGQNQIPSPAVVSIVPPRSVSSAETSVVEDKQEEDSKTLSMEDGLSSDSGSVPALTGCKACGKPEIVNGCNGEGRIQGGIATVPGFGWWPIKAYRPCPAFVASGGRYRRYGQSMDEVVSGGGGRGSSK